MATKHYRLTVHGEPTAEQIHAAVGAHGGTVLRVHREKGETHVYYSGDEPGDHHDRSLQGAGKPESVSADDVTKIG